MRLSDPERFTLAEIGKRLGRLRFNKSPVLAKPDTILAWYRRLIAHKFDGSQFRASPGRPRIASDLEALIVRFARENSGWGYDRIVGALANLGHSVSDQTVGSNILRRYGMCWRIGRSIAKRKRYDATGLPARCGAAQIAAIDRKIANVHQAIEGPGHGMGQRTFNGVAYSRRPFDSRVYILYPPRKNPVDATEQVLFVFLSPLGDFSEGFCNPNRVYYTLPGAPEYNGRSWTSFLVSLRET
jgi:hypothetical protein